MDERAEGYTEQALDAALKTGDYIRAARIIAQCSRKRYPAVAALLKKAGIDVAELPAEMSPPAPSTDETPEDRSRKEQIIEFVSRQVPADWPRWNSEQRREYWAGSISTDGLELVERDRISAIEVWCELFGGNPQDTRRNTRFINSVLTRLPGWKGRQVRIGTDYGSVKGFVHTERYRP